MGDKPLTYVPSVLYVSIVVISTVIVVGMIGACLLKRRRLPLREELEDGATDVLFLKSDEELDFSIAKPRSN